VGDECRRQEGQREAEGQCPPGEAPGRSQIRETDAHAIGEEHAEQGELGQPAGHLIGRADVDQTQHPVAQQEPGDEEDHRR